MDRTGTGTGGHSGVTFLQPFLGLPYHLPSKTRHDGLVSGNCCEQDRTDRLSFWCVSQFWDSNKHGQGRHRDLAPDVILRARACAHGTHAAHLCTLPARPGRSSASPALSRGKTACKQQRRRARAGSRWLCFLDGPQTERLSLHLLWASLHRQRRFAAVLTRARFRRRTCGPWTFNLSRVDRRYRAEFQDILSRAPAGGVNSGMARVLTHYNTCLLRFSCPLLLHHSMPFGHGVALLPPI